MKYCPEEVLGVFKEKFDFPIEPIFGVVATKGKEGTNIRMMRIYDIDTQGQLILLTHTNSKKWGEFNEHSFVSICMVSDDKLTQIIFHSKVKLETKQNAPETASFYWERIRPDVKKLYDPVYHADQSYQETPVLVAPEEAPDTSGIVIVQPYFWETLELVTPYTNSHRFQFHFSPSGWTKTRMSL